jgi:hypothetical protein
MRRLAMAAMLAMAGCATDPMTDLLPPGADAVTYNDPDDSSLEGVDRSRTIDIVAIEVGKASSLPGMTIEILDVGTKVRVADDPGPAAERRRPVKVRVLEGRNAEAVGTIPRDNLRPVPR